MSENHCAGCGMTVQPDDYHPYAACVMYRQCRQSEKVNDWMRHIKRDGASAILAALEEPSEEMVRRIDLATGVHSAFVARVLQAAAKELRKVKP